MKDPPVEESVERPLPERERKQIALDQRKTFVDTASCRTEGFKDIIHSHDTTAMTLEDRQIPSFSAPDFKHPAPGRQITFFQSREDQAGSSRTGPTDLSRPIGFLKENFLRFIQIRPVFPVHGQPRNLTRSSISRAFGSQGKTPWPLNSQNVI